MEIITNEQGDTWFVANGTVVMYVSRLGLLHVKGDIIAYSDSIPPLPREIQNNDGMRQCTITELYTNKVRTQQ